jgi:hypothetical protein
MTKVTLPIGYLELNYTNQMVLEILPVVEVDNLVEKKSSACCSSEPCTYQFTSVG